ncbi:MAG: AEC family transporter, partial [Ahrensia sp.]
MLAIFQTIAPIFLIIALGIALRRTPVFDDAFWTGLDRMAFYVLYPVLLFVTILKADFGALSIAPVFYSIFLGWAAVAAVTLALWPVLRARGVSGPTFSSVFQGAVRWNGFVALTAAYKMFPPEGAAMVALIMAAIIIPINVAAVTVVIRFSDNPGSSAHIGTKILLNPMILGVVFALLVRQLPFGVPEIITDGLDLIARAALGMGLLAIGAGLNLKAALRPSAPVWIATVFKLALYPAVVIAFAILLGLQSDQLEYLALCAAVPTAMNGYVVARQMGGDAPTYAAIATVQTAIAFISIPV